MTLNYVLGWMQHVLQLIIPISLTVALVSVPVIHLYFFIVRRRMLAKRTPVDCVHVGIFHPYCNDGGGGEKVMWTAVRAILRTYPKTKLVLYTGDVEYSPSEILQRVRQRFDIDLPGEIEFIYLRKRKWINPYTYPYFTLFGQSLGSVCLAIEALLNYLPDVYLDTMGYSFTYPIFKYLGQCKVACYTHYPTITSDMLRRVSGRILAPNNRNAANSPFLTAGKLLYYQIFAWVYTTVGKCADVVMVNSTWTEEHINELWQMPLSTHRVFPPCDVEDLKLIPRSFEEYKPDSLIKIISIGQFRPEKNHPLQLRAMYELRQILPESLWSRIRLVLIGSCRNAQDRNRVRDMEDLCRHLSLEDNVIFKLNIPYEEMKKELSEGMIGIHAMWNEHFGIGVVECLAAGLITIAHNSGGPKSDIIIETDGSRNGFLASEDYEYAQAMATIIKMSPQQKERIVLAARALTANDAWSKQYPGSGDVVIRFPSFNLSFGSAVGENLPQSARQVIVIPPLPGVSATEFSRIRS